MKDYPLHPGQTSMPPQFVQIPLENYDSISKELEELRKHEVEWDLAKARIKELESERRWRKFPEERPEKDAWCLVYHEGEIDSDHYTDDCNNHYRFVIYGNDVTHWMPLPKRPEDAK